MIEGNSSVPMGCCREISNLLNEALSGNCIPLCFTIKSGILTASIFRLTSWAAYAAGALPLVLSMLKEVFNYVCVEILWHIGSMSSFTWDSFWWVLSVCWWADGQLLINMRETRFENHSITSLIKDWIFNWNQITDHTNKEKSLYKYWTQYFSRRYSSSYLLH